MVKSRRQLEKELRKLKKTKKGFVFPEGVDPKQFGKGLRARQKITLMRVIESQASPSQKARARIMLAKI